MVLNGSIEYISAKTGKKKGDGTPWYLLKFHDTEAEDYFEIFASSDQYSLVCNLPKHTLLNLSMQLTPGKTFVTLLNIQLNDK